MEVALRLKAWNRKSRWRSPSCSKASDKPSEGVDRVTYNCFLISLPSSGRHVSLLSFGVYLFEDAAFRFHYFLIYHIISFSVITVNFLVNCISAHGAWWLLHPIVQCARETRKKSEWIKKYGAKKGKTIMELRKRVTSRPNTFNMC